MGGNRTAARNATEVIRVTPFAKQVFDLFLTEQSIRVGGKGFTQSDALVALFQTGEMVEYIERVRELNPELEDQF